MGEGGGGQEDEEGRGKRLRDGSGREEEGGRLLAVTGGAVKRKRGERERASAGARGDSIMMQRWRGGGTLELARALAIGRSANHSFGNNRLHTLHTKDTRETAKNCPEWGCSLQGSDDVVYRCQARTRNVSVRSAFPLACDEGREPFSSVILC